MSDRHPARGYGRPRVRLRGGRLEPVADAGGRKRRVVERGGRLIRLGDKPPAGGAPAATTEAAADPVVGRPTGRVERVLITLFIGALLLPTGWQLGPLRLTPFLTALLIGFVPLVVVWLRNQTTRVILPDYLIAGFCFWSSTALILDMGFSASLEPNGILFLTTLGAYLMGRVLVRDAASMAWMIMIGVGVFALMLPALVLESATGAKPLLALGGLIGDKFPTVIMDPRYGIRRAQGSFEHPIAMGIFAASLLAPAVYIVRNRAPRILRLIGAPVIVVAGICSVSTGAILTLNVQFGLMLWSRVFRAVKARWRVLTILLAVLYVAVDLVSERTPFHVFVNYAAFSSGSSYNRILIWQFGSAEALRHPFFGIGMGDWERPRWMHASMDNFWLVEAVRYGIPAFLMLAGAIFIILRRAGRVDWRSEEVVLMRRGMTFSIIGTSVAIASVHLWNAGYVWFLFVIGSTAWMALPADAAKAPGRTGR